MLFQALQGPLALLGQPVRLDRRARAVRLAGRQARPGPLALRALDPQDHEGLSGRQDKQGFRERQAQRDRKGCAESKAQLEQPARKEALGLQDQLAQPDQSALLGLQEPAACFGETRRRPMSNLATMRQLQLTTKRGTRSSLTRSALAGTLTA